MKHNNSKGLKPLMPGCRNVVVVSIILINCLFASSTWAHDYKTFPPTEITLPDSFIKFRSDLKTALDTKNVDAVRSFLAENITFGFGGSSGPDQFIADIGLADAGDEGWKLLSHLISTDVAEIDLDQTVAYMMPYTAETWPENDDPSSIVIGNAVTELRAMPSEEGRIVSTLKHPILRIKSETKNGEWLEVEASNGLWGYIPEAETVSYLGYRMLIENKSNNDTAMWKISFVGAGD